MKLELKIMTEAINKIINCNHSVVSTFDNMYDGTISKYISKEKAVDIINTNDGMMPKRLYGKKIVHNLAIVGEVDFNGSSAYVFNKEIPYTKGEIKSITGRLFNELKECYVFTSIKISPNLLEQLIKEYYDRGGYKFENYYDYEDQILKPLRASLNKDYRTGIVENIFKHQYQETKKLTWSNGVYKIKQVENKIIRNNTAKFSIIDLDLDLSFKIQINSIFGSYFSMVNLLSDNKIIVKCHCKNNTHSIVIFTIEKL